MLRIKECYFIIYIRAGRAEMKFFLKIREFITTFLPINFLRWPSPCFSKNSKFTKRQTLNFFLSFINYFLISSLQIDPNQTLALDYQLYHADVPFLQSVLSIVYHSASLVKLKLAIQFLWVLSSWEIARNEKVDILPKQAITSR